MGKWCHAHGHLKAKDQKWDFSNEGLYDAVPHLKALISDPKNISEHGHGSIK